jgi:Tol biopolymer transport system component
MPRLSLHRVVVLALGALIATGCGDLGGRSGGLDPGRVEDGSMTVTWSDNMPLYSPDGHWVALVTFEDGRWVISTGPVGAGRDQITSSEHGDGSPAWSPDGSKLVYYPLTKDSFDLGMDWDGSAAWRQSEGIYVADRDGSDSRQLTDGDDLAPCWAADGRTIVFQRWTNWVDLTGVYTVSTEQNGPKLLVRGATSPACSPTESKIAFVDEQGRILVLDLRSRTKRVVAVARGASAPAWSPDGSRIAFDAGREGENASTQWRRTEIYVVNAAGTRVRRLTRNAYADTAPVWTSDGRIMFKRFGQGAPGVYVMNSDGSGTHRVRVPRS